MGQSIVAAITEYTAGTYSTSTAGTVYLLKNAYRDRQLGAIYSYSGYWDWHTTPASFIVADIDGGGHWGVTFPDDAPAGAGMWLSFSTLPENNAFSATADNARARSSLPIYEFDLCPHYAADGVSSGDVPIFGGNIYVAEKLAFTISGGTATFSWRGVSIPADEWTHIKIVITEFTAHDKASYNLYIGDADAIAVTNASWPAYTPYVWMGGLGYTTSSSWGAGSSRFMVANLTLSYYDAYPIIKPSLTIADAGSTREALTLKASNIEYEDIATGADVTWLDGDTGDTLATGNTVTVDAVGTYLAHVVDSNDMSNYDVREVVDPNIEFYSLTWSTGETGTDSITVTDSGTYTVTVENGAGSASASVTVTLAGGTAMSYIFEGDPVPVGHWIFGTSSEYRTGLATVQSQYATSPVILALAVNYWDTLNPGKEVDTMLNSMINPLTATGYGLDVWGRIVGIKRALVPVDGTYLAYDPPSGTNEQGDNWDNAPFNPVTSQGYAGDAIYRVYVLVKALMNIGNGSLGALNYYFAQMYPDTGIKILHVGTMVIRILDTSARLTDADVLALSSIDWVPAGVGWQIWQGDTDCFGFAGSELQPFDQAPFISDDALRQF